MNPLTFQVCYEPPAGVTMPNDVCSTLTSPDSAYGFNAGAGITWKITPTNGEVS